MRSMKRSLFLVAAGLILAIPVQAKTVEAKKPSPPYPINGYYHNPLDLSVKRSLAPKTSVADQRFFVVSPPQHIVADLSDPDTVKWPTVDRPEWERLQAQYVILPNPHAK